MYSVCPIGGCVLDQAYLQGPFCMNGVNFAAKIVISSCFFQDLTFVPHCLLTDDCLKPIWILK